MAVPVAGTFGVLAFASSSALGGERTLADFATPQEARDFTSAHLPTALPGDTVIESLSYARWTDWYLNAQVRFPSASAAEAYLDRVRQTRALRDDYCYDGEPAFGARYYLPSVSACGAVEHASPEVLTLRCNTR